MAKCREKLQRFISEGIDIIHRCVRCSPAPTMGDDISNQADEGDQDGERTCPKPRRRARYAPADRNPAPHPVAGNSTIANAKYGHCIPPDRYSPGTTQEACQINDPGPTALITMVYAPIRQVGIVILTDR